MGYAQNLKAQRDSVNVVAASSTAQTIPDPDTAATISRITLTANCTLTFPALPVPGLVKAFSLTAVQDGTGSRTITWPSTVRWAAGVAPTLTTGANKVDRFTFLSDDGATWTGFVAGQNFAAT